MIVDGQDGWRGGVVAGPGFWLWGTEEEVVLHSLSVSVEKSHVFYAMYLFEFFVIGGAALTERTRRSTS